MKYVVLYESAEDVLAKAPHHYPAHKSRLDDFHRRGEILMVGTFGDPQNEGSMASFPTREAAESFVAGDPFVLNGVVQSYQRATTTASRAESFLAILELWLERIGRKAA